MAQTALSEDSKDSAQKCIPKTMLDAQANKVK